MINERQTHVLEMLFFVHFLVVLKIYFSYGKHGKKILCAFFFSVCFYKFNEKGVYYGECHTFGV